MNSRDDRILSNYDYEIPHELIAQKPAEKRESSGLFVVHKDSGAFEHKKFSEIADYFNEGDCFVINKTKVVPSRLFGKKSSGGRVELLFLEPCRGGDEYEVLMKPFLEPGKKIFFDGGYECVVKARTADGAMTVVFNKPGVTGFLEKYGIMPLPPYINRKDGLAERLSDFDKERYQTVYARVPGAIAAPTAGLHFTDEILTGLKRKGIIIAELILHVGWGTFKPIVSADLGDHKMMSEKYSLDAANAALINSASGNGRKIVSVGTTSVRALESVAAETGFIENGKTLIKGFSGETSIFIYPGYKFKIVSTLITNLHLPKSTPLMMASAFASRKLMLKAYKEAVAKHYRFFSYGDSMLII